MVKQNIIPKHPIFEIAQEIPVFVIKNQIYTADEEIDFSVDNFNGAPLIEIGNLKEIGERYLEKEQEVIENFKENFANRIKPSLTILNLDIPQLIYTKILPYFRSSEDQKPIAPLSLSGKRLEEIIQFAEEEISSKVEEIEAENRRELSEKRKQERLSELLEVPKEKIKKEPKKEITQKEIFENITEGRDVVFIENETYSLVEEGRAYDPKVTIGGIPLYIQPNPRFKGLEKKFEGKLIKKLMSDSIKENFTKEKITEELMKQEPDVLAIRGLHKYAEEDFGFRNIEGNYYVYLNVPAFILNVRRDNYLFDESKVMIPINFDEKDNPLISYSHAFIYQEKERHPYAWNDEELSLIKTGIHFEQEGEPSRTILNNLLKAREIVMFQEYPNEVHEYREILYNKLDNFESHKISDEDVEKLNLPITKIYSPSQAKLNEVLNKWRIK